MPVWTMQAGVNWLHRKQTAYLYPYGVRQRLTVYEPFVSVCRNFIATRSNAVWTLALDASFRQGNGEPSAQFTVHSSEFRVLRRSQL